MPYPVAAVRNRNFGIATPFTGAYDAIPSIMAAYGMRRLRTAYTGSILRVRRSSDNTEQDIGYGSDGDLDTAAVSSFIGGGSGYIVKWYDQSSNGYDASQTTAASQPLYVASGQNGRPVGRWDGVDDFLITGAIDLSATDAVDLFLLGNLSSDAVVTRVLLELSDNVNNYTDGFVFAFSNSKISIFHKGDIGNSIFDSTTTHGGWKLFQNRYNKALASAETSARINGAVVAGTQTADANNTNAFGNRPFYIGMRGGATFPFIGDIAELIICNAALSDANRQAAEASAASYWGITL